jgi:predicted nucleic acid-binding Zn ribbon protein
VGSFLDFLQGLSPHRYCIPCLARLYNTPEPLILAALQNSVGVEHRVDVCRNCTNLSETYRIHGGVPNISGGSGLASAETPEPRPTCPVCGGSIVSGETVIFDHGEVVHVDCHWDRPRPRRPLSRAMRWPR